MRVHKSCHAHEWGMPRICMSHVTRMNESRHPCIHISRANIRRDRLGLLMRDCTSKCSHILCCSVLQDSLWETAREALTSVVAITCVCECVCVCVCVFAPWRQGMPRFCRMRQLAICVWMGHVTHMNETRHTHEWVTAEWVMSHTHTHHCMKDGTSSPSLAVGSPGIKLVCMK